MAIKALTFDNANNVESRNDAYWYNFITKSISGASVGIIKDGSNMEPHRNENKIIFDHGYIVIFGRILEMDKGTELIIPLANLDKTVNGKAIIRVNLRNEPGQQVFLTTTEALLKKDDLNKNISGIYEYELGSYEANHNTLKVYTDKRTYINSDYIETNTNSKINNVINDTNSKINGVKNEINNFEKEIKKYFDNPNNKYVVGQYMWTDGRDPGKGWIRQWNESKYRGLTLLIDYSGPSSGIVTGEAKRFSQKIDLEFRYTDLKKDYIRIGSASNVSGQVAAGGYSGTWSGIHLTPKESEWPNEVGSNPNYNKAAGFYAALWKFVGIDTNGNTNK